MNQNPKENQRLIYPEDTSEIISELMEKYGLKETEEEVLQALKEGKTTKGGTIAEIIMEVAKNKIPRENITSVLQKRLAISKEIAKKIAKELEKKILNLIIIEKVPKKEIPPLQKPPISPLKPGPPVPPTEFPPKAPPEEKPKKPDIYREPIE